MCAQVSDIASRGEHGSSTTNPEVINMLRGGVLYVKVRKPQQALPGTPDLPSKAAQVHSLVSMLCPACQPGFHTPAAALLPCTAGIMPSCSTCSPCFFWRPWQ